MPEIQNSFEKSLKKIQGDGPIEKQIILLKLSHAIENAPEFGEKSNFEINSPERQWLSVVGALLSRVSIERKIQYQASYRTLAQFWKSSSNQIKGQVLDAIEEIKLELELDGRDDIGNVYTAGEVYSFFADLKNIINSAEKEIFIIDPYLNGGAFNDYLSKIPQDVNLKIMTDRYVSDVKAYIERHVFQNETSIFLRRSKEIHDRIVFIDDNQGWVIGGSIKDAASKKPTYLLPLSIEMIAAKKEVYLDIWEQSEQID